MPQDIWELVCGQLEDGEYHLWSYEDHERWLVVVAGGGIVKCCKE